MGEEPHAFQHFTVAAFSLVLHKGAQTSGWGNDLLEAIVITVLCRRTIEGMRRGVFTNDDGGREKRMEEVDEELRLRRLTGFLRHWTSL